MNSTIISSSSIRFFKGSIENGAIFYPHLVNLMKEKFQFLEVPQQLDDFDPAKGVKFKHGIFQGKVIDSLEAYTDGVLVFSKYDTQFGDNVIDELLEMAVTKLNYTIEPIPTRERLYVSNLELELSKDILKNLGKFDKIINKINKIVGKYSDDKPALGIVGFTIGADASLNPSLKLPNFTFERRALEPFKDNKFFSTAPLSTEDHLALVNDLIEILS